MTEDERVREIEALNREIKKLSTKLAKEKLRSERLFRDTSHANLESNSVEGDVAIIIALLLAVVPLIWWVRAILFFIVGCLALRIVLRAPAKYALGNWWKLPLGIGVLCFVGLGGTINVRNQYQEESRPSAALEYLMFWGDANANHPNSPHVNESEVTVDGRLLQKFARRYNVMAVCFGYDGEEDVHDVAGISKSAVFNIVDQPILMHIPWNEQFMKNHFQGHHVGTTYVALLVPKSLAPDKFETMRDAINQGAIELEHAMGPP